MMTLPQRERTLESLRLEPATSDETTCVPVAVQATVHHVGMQWAEALRTHLRPRRCPRRQPQQALART